MPEYDSTILYREIPGHTGYRVGNDGSIWSCRRHNRYRVVLAATWHRLSCSKSRRGYLTVKLCNGTTGGYAKRPVHQLVLEAFVGPCPEGMEVCHHPDPNPGNNRLANLRWDTKKANAADSLAMGGRDSIRGVRHYRAKLDEDAVRAIRAARAAGEETVAIGKRYGVSGVLVSLIARRKSWAWLP